VTRYSIKDLEKYSGIKAHTIRMWEQRYEVLTPHRTDSNIRYYDESQLKRLLNISLLLSKGYKISKVSELDEEEFNDTVKRFHNESLDANNDAAVVTKVNGLILSMLELDENRFEKIFNTSLIKRGFEKTILEVIYPFLQRIGLMWRTGEVTCAQEHFITNLIRQKVVVAIDAIPMASGDAEKFLLFLPESEFNELVILLSTYLIKNKGKQCVYLGQDIPFNDVIQVSEITRPHALMTFITEPASFEESQSFIDRLSEAFPKKSIIISGNVSFMDDLQPPSNVTVVKDLAELNTVIY
jgi:DNA-binding transcriptional MerR regulator